MEIQLRLHLDRSNGSFISGHQVSVGEPEKKIIFQVQFLTVN